MEIKVSELKIILDRLLNHLVEGDIESIHIDNDYYWHIPSEELFDPYKKPNELNLGQLSDDWHDLQKVANGTNAPLISDLVDLAAILRAIGELGEEYLFTHD